MNSLFGTNGIRWIVDSNNINFPVKLGLSAGTYFGPGRNIAVGMDTRTSGPMIFNAVSSALKACGCNVIDLGIIPTPGVQFAVRELGLDGGLVVTASHNPPQFNGLKFVASDGTEFSREQEKRIDGIYQTDEFIIADWNRIGKSFRETDIQAKYRDSVGLRIERPLEVIVDCGNGTAGEYTPKVLDRLGCSVTTMNAQADGRFPGRLPEPTEENLGSLMAAVKNSDTGLGIAHDGDADRAIFVDELGNYITGDQSLALFAIHAVKKSNRGRVVLPVNISMTVLDVVRENGGEPIIIPVGSPLIARKLMEIDGVLGGEGNGGVIFPRHQFCRDGMMTAAKMVEIASGNGPVSGLVAELPKYCLKRSKLELPPGIIGRVLERVKEQAQGRILDIDGVKIIHDDYWTLVRPSGTEPVLRVTVEADTTPKCEAILTDQVKWVKEIIRDLS